MYRRPFVPARWPDPERTARVRSSRAPWFSLSLRRCSLVHAVEVPFERIDVSGPELPELSQPRIQLLQWLGSQAIETALCVHLRLHETRFAQHPQVLRDRWL